MKAVEQTKRTQGPKKILCADTPITCLETTERVARESSTVGNLGLRQPP